MQNSRRKCNVQECRALWIECKKAWVNVHTSCTPAVCVLRGKISPPSWWWASVWNSVIRTKGLSYFKHWDTAEEFSRWIFGGLGKEMEAGKKDESSCFYFQGNCWGIISWWRSNPIWTHICHGRQQTVSEWERPRYKSLWKMESFRLWAGPVG